MADFHISLLAAGHVVAGFECGDAARNAWLQGRAFASQANDDSRVYVAADTDGRVVGFYAITTGCILRAMLPGGLRRNAPDPVSCVLLAQLGVATSHQGRGLSVRLVLHAMGQVLKVADITGCRLLAVHPANDGLVAYYRKFGFVAIEAQGGPIMAMTLKNVRALLEIT